MQEALKSFKKYLASNALKLTQQRLLILKVFMSEDGEINSENLLKAVQDIDPAVSRSTVYRTIKHFHHAGIARCIHHRDGSSHYEPTGDHNCHMVCERCGTTTPILNPYMDCLQQETARQQGFTLSHYRTTLYGLCGQCRAALHSAKSATCRHTDNQD